MRQNLDLCKREAGGAERLLSVKKALIFDKRFKDGNVYKRIGDRTVLKAGNDNSFKTIDNSSLIIESIAPNTMAPGDEIIIRNALKLKPHKNDVVIKYLYGSNGITVLTPFQDSPNHLKLKPSDEETSWHIKYCADNSIAHPCTKHQLIVVEELIHKIWPYYLSRITFWLLVIASFMPLAKSFFRSDSTMRLEILGLYYVPIPLITILSIVLLSNRITKIIERLSVIKIESQVKFREKCIGNSTEIVKRASMQTVA